MKKELVIAAKFDTSDFDKSVELMQKKLKDLYAPADMIRAQTMQQNITTNGRLGQNGNNQLDGGSVEAFKKATQSARRELDTLINREVASQNKLGKELATKLDKLKELKVEQEKGNKTLEDELKIKKQIAEVEKSTWGMREQFKNRNENINTLIDAKEKNAPKGIERLMEGYQGGGMKGMMGAGKGMVGGMMNMSNLAGVMGWAGSAMTAGGALYRDYTRIGVGTAQAQGSAVQNTVGKDLGNVYSNRTGFDNIFSAERQRAASKAMEAYKGGRVSDILGVGGMALGTAGAAVGAFAGGPIGAGVIGGGLAAGAGLYNMATNQRSRDAFLSMFSDKYKGRYDADRAKGYATDFRETYEAEQNKNPVKKYAAEDFERNMGRNLNAQRAMGLTNDQFTGEKGYLKGVTNAGFTHEMGIGMSNEILGAGGSARMAKESGFGLQMQRMGVTNAGSVLGSLSGSLQNPESTKRATISIMSEAMKIGLDQSDFSEENRRFTQAAANIISRTGASGEKDQDRISAMLSQFMGERTNQGVTSATTAYEASQNRDSQLEGRRGTLRMVGAQSDPILSKLSSPDQTELLGMRPDDMNENNPEIVSMARKAGTTPQALVEAASKNNKSSRYTLPGQADEVNSASGKIKEFMKKSGMSKVQFGEAANNNSLPEDAMSALGDLETAQRRTNPTKFNRADALAGAMEEIPSNDANPEKSFGKTLKDSVNAMLNNSVRREDKMVESQAGDSEVVRKNFNEMSGEIDKAAESAAKMTTAVREMAIEFSNAIEQAEKKGNPVPMDDLIKKQAKMNTKNQQQSGKGP